MAFKLYTKHLKEHYRSAQPTEPSLKREALLKQTLSMIIKNRNHDPAYTGLIILCSAPAENTEKAAFAVDFIKKWYESIDVSNPALISFWNTFTIPPALKNGSVHEDWRELKKTAQDAEVKYFHMHSISDVNRIMHAKMNISALGVSGELLWQTLVTGIETGRILASYLQNNLNKTGREFHKITTVLTAISDNIEILAGKIAGLDPDIVEALKNECLDPRPYDKKELILATVSSGAYACKKQRPSCNPF